MQAHAIDSRAAWPEEIAPPGGVLVLSGYGLQIRVWRGRLRCDDGFGRQRRTLLVHRATGGLARLVVLGHTGSISLEAIRWCADVGAAYLQLDADGRVLAAFGRPGTDRPALRRAQALAMHRPVGLEIARDLIAEKLRGQAETLQLLAHQVPTDSAQGEVEAALERLVEARDIDAVRLAEAQGAAAYWQAWSALPVRFARRDAERVPLHWRMFGSRSSPLTGGPRLAVSPAQALENYLYASLEGEATIAARIVGLDPGLGVLHADQLNRDSLAADLMEPIRPLVDRYLLELLTSRTFAARDFFETRQGVCRVVAPLTHELGETATEWGKLVGRVAEDVAKALDGSSRTPSGMPTPISGRRRSAGRPTGGQRTAGPTATPRVAHACLWCGKRLQGQRRTCRGECERAVTAKNTVRLGEIGAQVLAAHRERGAVPEWAPEAREQLGRTESDMIRLAREWQRQNPWPADMGTFEREILPALADVSAGDLARRTGLSAGYCRRIKQGLVVPHPMWWEKLVAPTGTDRGGTAGAPATTRDS